MREGKEIKPCPVCGRADTNLLITRDTFEILYVQCNGCGKLVGMETNCKDDNAAIDAWNRRCSNEQEHCV